MNFPRVSKEYSFFPVSTPNMLTFPMWLPVATYWESGEKASDQASTARKEENKTVRYPVMSKYIYFCCATFERRSGKEANHVLNKQARISKVIFSYFNEAIFRLSVISHD